MSSKIPREWPMIDRVHFAMISTDNQLHMVRRHIVRLVSAANRGQVLACLPISTIQEITGLVAAEKRLMRKFDRYDKLARRHENTHSIVADSLLPW